MHDLRIAIDGAQSTGKTTLWEQLRDHYGPKLRFIPEAARRIAAQFGVFNDQDWPSLVSDVPRLSAFFNVEEEWQMNQELCGGRFVTDSSLYLIQAYRVAFGIAINETVLRQTRYDIVFYCPVANAFKADGFRFVAHREEIDAAYTGIVTAGIAGHLVRLTAHNYLDVAVTIIDAAINERSCEG